MRPLLVDIVIATGFVAACFATALILYGITFDVRRWLDARGHADEQPVVQWGDVIDQDVDWSAWERDVA